MMCYVVVDTNVLVSALLAKNNESPTVQIIKLLFEGKIIPVFNNYTFDEYKNVLHRKKFNFDSELVDTFLSELSKIGRFIEPAKIDIELPDIKDLPFYELVMESGSSDSYLVTGNIKHFPKKPFIVTPTEFIRIVEQSGLPLC